MTPQERFELAEQHNLRVEQVIDIGSLAANDSFNTDGWEDFEYDLAYGEPDKGTHPSILPLMAHVKSIVDEFGEDDDAIREELPYRLAQSRTLGYAVQFATPVRRYRRGAERGGSFMFSWGYYSTVWIYADTLEDAWAAAAKWAEDQAERDYKNSQKED